MALRLSPRAFAVLQRMFHDVSGINLSDDKLALVQVRLASRVEARGYQSFDEYCQYLQAADNGEERQVVIDSLTTNETYFFREPNHFRLLGQELSTRFRGQPVRVWSAACASGEEAYSAGMTLLDRRPEGNWEVLGTDLSTRMIERAQLGVFAMQRLESMPSDYLQRFCLRGKSSYKGMLRVDEDVRRRVQFKPYNLMHDLRPLGMFEVIFLRNVLIYFDHAGKQDILHRVLARLRPRGLLFIGHAEPLQGLVLPIQRVFDAVFEKVP